jgi:HPt (histidine-containing phosphotransfer) domain-containing protein
MAITAETESGRRKPTRGFASMDNGVMMTQEIDELRSLLGPERVVALLGKFRSELEPPFTTKQKDAAATRDRAHRIVSQAGMLGFHLLSEAARQLESAIGDNAELAGAVAGVVAKQNEVLIGIPRLLRELKSPSMIESR